MVLPVKIGCWDGSIILFIFPNHLERLEGKHILFRGSQLFISERCCLFCPLVLNILLSLSVSFILKTLSDTYDSMPTCCVLLHLFRCVMLAVSWGCFLWHLISLFFFSQWISSVECICIQPLNYNGCSPGTSLCTSVCSGASPHRRGLSLSTLEMGHWTSQIN